MSTSSPEGFAERSPSAPVRDVSRLVIEHPIPIYDPFWLRRLYQRCLWDGGSRTTKPDFCSGRCEELYAEWEHRTGHVVIGREPLQTFLEQGQDV